MFRKQLSLSLNIILIQIFVESDAIFSKECDNFNPKSRIDGITQWKEGTVLIFKSSDLWKINVREESCFHYKVIDLFNNVLLEDGIGAITYWARFDLTIIFKDKYFWFVDNDMRMTEGMFINSKNIWDGIDAAMIIANPQYDGFGQFDNFYFFKGQIVWKFNIYKFNGEIFIESAQIEPIDLSRLYYDPLPKTFDSAFIDGQFAYLFKDNLQYRLDASEFLENIDKQQPVIEELLTGIIFKRPETFLQKIGFYAVLLSPKLMEISDCFPFSMKFKLNPLSKLFLLSLMFAVMICFVIILCKITKILARDVRFEY